MSKTFTFLHTSPVHVATFDHLLAELAPDIPARHIVDESLLNEARAAGGITPQLEQRITGAILEAIAQDAAIILCTCSTIGGCAEGVSRLADRPVLRVDRAMAEQAVALGRRIIVAAALASTLVPTCELIRDAACRSGKDVHLIELLCESTWAKFEQGDQAGYLQEIAACLRRVAPDGDVIVLAQASMAGAAALCAGLPIPILSSPRLGLEAAIKIYQATLSSTKESS